MPKKKDDPYKYELGKILEKHHGFDNWYDWSWENWGTKWGTYDNKFFEKDREYTYTTAWSPLSEDIIEMLAKYIPTFKYHWEEEQGYGAESEYENGERVFYEEYDIPDEDLQYL